MSNSSNKRAIPVFMIMLIILSVIFLLSFIVGRYEMTFTEMINGLIHRYDVNDSAYNSMVVMLKVRLPRILGAMLIGGALSMSGAAFQAVFGNPLVSPDLLGTSSGAGLGACIAILSGLSTLPVQLSALCGGILATAATISVSRSIMRKSCGLVVYILVGLVFSAVFEAGISITKYIADPYSDLEQITYWLLGSLRNVTFTQLGIAVIPILIGIIILIFGSYKANLFSFSDEEVSSLGINVCSFRMLILFGATLLCAASVATSGIVGWIGLVVPHITRILIGPDNKYVFPLAFVTGAAFLLVIDDISRSLLYFEIPISILTGAIGAPVFLFIMFKGTKNGWK